VIASAPLRTASRMRWGKPGFCRSAALTDVVGFATVARRWAVWRSVGWLAESLWLRRGGTWADVRYVTLRSIEHPRGPWPIGREHLAQKRIPTERRVRLTAFPIAACRFEDPGSVAADLLSSPNQLFRSVPRSSSAPAAQNSGVVDQGSPAAHRPAHGIPRSGQLRRWSAPATRASGSRRIVTPACGTQPRPSRVCRQRHGHVPRPHARATFQADERSDSAIPDPSLLRACHPLRPVQSPRAEYPKAGPACRYRR